MLIILIIFTTIWFKIKMKCKNIRWFKYIVDFIYEKNIIRI